MPVEPTSVDAALRGVDEFFMARGPVHKTMRMLARRLSDEGINYAFIGGMALVLHGYRRETIDVDVMLDEEGRKRFANRLVGRGYATVFPDAKKRFRDTGTGVEIHFLVHGDFPVGDKPNPVVVPRPGEASIEMGGIRVVTLEKLIELKLASGMTAPDRLRDLADVQELIRIKRLDAEFVKRLNPYVADKYLELWNAVARAVPDEGP